MIVKGHTTQQHTNFNTHFLYFTSAKNGNNNEVEVFRQLYGRHLVMIYNGRYYSYSNKESTVVITPPSGIVSVNYEPPSSSESA